MFHGYPIMVKKIQDIPIPITYSNEDFTKSHEKSHFQSLEIDSYLSYLPWNPYDSFPKKGWYPQLSHDVPSSVLRETVLNTGQAHGPNRRGRGHLRGVDPAHSKQRLRAGGAAALWGRLKRDADRVLMEFYRDISFIYWDLMVFNGTFEWWYSDISFMKKGIFLWFCSWIFRTFWLWKKKGFHGI